VLSLLTSVIRAELPAAELIRRFIDEGRNKAGLPLLSSARQSFAATVRLAAASSEFFATDFGGKRGMKMPR